MGRSLLVLGEPGAGKTTTLLELARHCADRACTVPGEPIPVVFTLSSWRQQGGKFADWLVDELNRRYQIPEKIGRAWIDNDDLLLLLDGLDEVAVAHRAECVDAVNEFRSEHGLTAIVVSSRVAEHRELTVKLSLLGAVLLQPLDPAAVNRYIESAGPKLAVLSALLARDSALRELAASPLMLSIMSLAYTDAPASLVQESGSQSVILRRKHLFETYVKRMFRRRTRWSATDTVLTDLRLKWLARLMQYHGHTIFLLEQLQPTCLATRRQRWIYVFGTRLLAGFGLATALTLASLERCQLKPSTSTGQPWHYSFSTLYPVA